jgi:hypothetical protein
LGSFSNAVGTWFHEVSRVAAPIFKLLRSLLGLAFLVAIVYGVYGELDKAGWISRDHDTPTWIGGDWMVGEYRECDLLTTTAVVEGTSYSKDDLLHLPRLYCGRGEGGFFEYAGQREGTDVSWDAIGKDFHTFSVKYWGRLERPDRWKDAWRCKRLGESIECKALN